MREFVLLFRMDIVNEEAQPKAVQMDVYMQQWVTWIEGMKAQGCVVQGGNHLSKHGTVFSRGGVEKDGPYVSNDVSVAGYLVVQAPDRERALVVARQCPILFGEGTSVELREIATPG